ncbi:MAG: 3-deoxy-D-manno-octulosonic acid transferase [bacterium]
MTCKILYNFIISLVAPLVYLSSLYFHGRKGFWQRLGYFPFSPQQEGIKGSIWVHAVSGGEVAAAVPIIQELKKTLPDQGILLSTSTEAGLTMSKKISAEIEAVFYFPLDLPWIIKRVLNNLNPRAIIILETEIWPNLVWKAARRNIPVIMINGCIQDKNLPAYRRFSLFFKDVLRSYALCCMQTKEDGERLKSIGAEEGKVVITGNTKFDQPAPLTQDTDPALLKIKEEWELSETGKIIVAGSTHPGEEEIIFDAFQQIQRPEVRLITAPRHLKRIKEVEDLLKKRGRRYCLRSRGTDPEAEVMVLDTYGELAGVYGLADLVFVGGSLVPIGGHNPIEPALLGKPILFGPYMENFRDIRRILLAKKAAIEVSDGDQLTEKLVRLLNYPAEAASLGQAALEVIEENRGAARRDAELIARLL